MTNQITLTGSIVLFKENLADLDKTINCFLNIELPKKLYLIDNTSTKFYEYVFVHKDIEYIAVENNIGFGSAHNKVIKEITNKSKFHLILNPDVSFKPNVVPNLIDKLDIEKSVSMIAPKVVFPNGEHQFSCRRYPTSLELIIRRTNFLKPIFKNIVDKGEYKDKDLSKPFNPEYITGCFQLYKTKDLIKIKGFDERYFLYMEDVDICKKIDMTNKEKLYYPEEKITHILKQGSSKSFKLFFRHLISAFKYYRKWGFS
ncbi:MAG: glycosyltransferase [Flavobacteriaceae bacterium]